MPNVPGSSNLPAEWWNSPTSGYLANQYPGMQNYMNWRWGQKNNSVAGWLSDPGASLAVMLRNLGGPAGYMGYSTLADIMASQGKTDPRLFNQNLVDISRGGEGMQRAIDQNLTQRGWENSGVGAALKAATAGSTENRLAQAKAQEAATAEARKRADLDLLLRLFVQPSLQGAEIATGYQTSRNAQQSQQDAARSAQMQNLLLALGTMFG